jgi:dTDP-4-dehydrorhamnose 3,5-epimerase-like enzyme
MIESQRIIQLPKFFDPRGNLTFLQNRDQIPFDIKRVFLTYDVPGGETRGGHAYKTQEEIIIALSGSFDVLITDKNGQKEKINLSRSYYGLYLPPNTWRHMENFSTNSFGLHLSSSFYNELDYIRDFNFYCNE